MVIDPALTFSENTAKFNFPLEVMTQSLESRVSGFEIWQLAVLVECLGTACLQAMPTAFEILLRLLTWFYDQHGKLNHAMSNLYWYLFIQLSLLAFRFDFVDLTYELQELSIQNPRRFSTYLGLKEYQLPGGRSGTSTLELIATTVGDEKLLRFCFNTTEVNHRCETNLFGFAGFVFDIEGLSKWYQSYAHVYEERASSEQCESNTRFSALKQLTEPRRQELLEQRSSKPIQYDLTNMRRAIELYVARIRSILPLLPSEACVQNPLPDFTGKTPHPSSATSRYYPRSNSLLTDGESSYSRYRDLSTSRESKSQISGLSWALEHTKLT